VSHDGVVISSFLVYIGIVLILTVGSREAGE